MSTTGKSTPFLLTLLALAVAATAAVWIWSSRPPDASALARLAPSDLPPAEYPTAPIDSVSQHDARTSREGSAGQTAPLRPARPGGRGSIRGDVHCKPPIVFPERWTLHVEPHPYLAGRELAETREIHFEKGERTFRVDDLPLAGYSARAEAVGLNCLPASALLVAGSEHAFVTLMLLPSGFIDGSVLDATGVPAAGLDVTLESVDTEQRATASTDASGSFTFRDVLDGEYRLYYGRPEAPLLAVESLAFQAPALRFPTRTLPPTANLAIEVLDAARHPKAAVRISGSAPKGGAVDIFTNHMGQASAKYLVPGHYFIDARTEDGLEASAGFDLAAGEQRELQMVVRDRR